VLFFYNVDYSDYLAGSLSVSEHSLNSKAARIRVFFTNLIRVVLAIVL